MKFRTLVVLTFSLFGTNDVLFSSLVNATPFAMIEHELNFRPDHLTARFEMDGAGAHAWIELTPFWAGPEEVGPSDRSRVELVSLSVRRLDQKGKVELVLDTGTTSVICARSVWQDRPVNSYTLQETGNCVLYPHLESRRTKNGTLTTRRTFAVIELQVRESI